MTRIIIDPALQLQLERLQSAAELCDKSGRVLGRFVPALDHSDWQPASPDITEEELDERERSASKTYSTAQVLRHLEQL